ncbi:hypothetical protein [Dehalogenimonas sp. 4OHTPN]|uniref:Uncharacterized protein n=1 Tax=Dehalogenimonas sp. 4OHTPN TaxID=3166643 RepID=A0AAU8G835_9CHLR
MGENVIILGLGLLFMIIGVILLFSGHGEERWYYDRLSRKRDLREFVTHDPERPEPGSLRTGGWIALAVGLVIIGVWVFFGAG